MLTVVLKKLATYQQIVQQHWYQYQEDNPEKEGDWQKGNLILTLLLVEDFIIVQFSSCHGHHLYNSTSGMAECIALENENTVVCNTLLKIVHTVIVRQGKLFIRIISYTMKYMQIFNYNQKLG